MGPGRDIERSVGNQFTEKGFLQDILNCIQDGISVLDSDLNILFVNQSMEKWYAHQLPLTGKKCYEAYHGRREPCEICPTLQTLESGKQRMEVVPFTGPEGVQGWLELFTFPLRDSGTGRMIGVIEYVRDISEQKRAEEAWRESEERFRKLSEASFEGVAIHENGIVLAANKTLAEMFGYEISDVIGMSWQELIAPEHRDYLLAKQLPHETVCLKKDGGAFVCRVQGREMPYQGRQVKVSAIRDITETKRAEEAIRESKDRLQLLIERMPIGCIMWNPEFRIEIWNPAAESIFGYTFEEAVGRHPYELIVTGDVQPHVNGIWKRLISGDATAHSVNENITRDGRKIMCEWFNTPLRHKDGTVVGIISMVQDITERKRAEMKLQQFTNDLQRSNRELEEFAAVASHDLQSPLISVLSALKLLEKFSGGGLGPEGEEYLNSARDRIVNMLEVVRGMLDYSRVDSVGIKFRSVGLEAALDRSIGNLMAEITESGAMVSHDPLPEVMGDAALLTQMFQNLISNAIRFQGDEPPRVHVSAEKKDHEWIISVSDNGIGIAPENTESIFNIFQSLKTKGEHGTGIGLATCKKIVELHGGRIWVESEPSHGSTFYFSIQDTEGDQA